MTQTLTLKEGIARLRKALAEGTVAVQRGKERCQYDYGDGVHCAIGAMMDEETLARARKGANNSFNLPRLVRDGVIIVRSTSELKELTYLQRAHDDEIHKADRSTEERVRNFEAKVRTIEERNGLLL